MSKISTKITVIPRQKGARLCSRLIERAGYGRVFHRRAAKALAILRSGNRLVIEKEFIDVETAKASGRSNFTEMVNYIKKHPASNLAGRKDRPSLPQPQGLGTARRTRIEIHLVKEGVVLSKI